MEFHREDLPRRRHCPICRYAQTVVLGERCPHDSSVLVAEDMLSEIPVAGRYRLIEPLAQGAFADVFVAADGRADRSLGRLVAVKRLQPHLRGESDTVARFDREGELLARLEGTPGVVHLVEHARTDQGDPFLALEYLDGQTLEAVLDSYGQMTVEVAARVVLELLVVLDGVHRAGLVHRDLKPSNVMMLAIDDRARLRLLDFGIARDPHRSDKRLTAPNRTFGTPNYMSPEQWSSASVDERSDLYSLGVIFYQMLAGRLPFEGDEVQVANQHRLTPVPSLDPALNVPASVEAVLHKALIKAPEARYANARVFHDALASALGLPLLDDLHETLRIEDAEFERHASGDAGRGTAAVPVVDPTESQSMRMTRGETARAALPPPPLVSRRRLALGVAAVVVAFVVAFGVTAGLGGGGATSVGFSPARAIEPVDGMARAALRTPSIDGITVSHGVDDPRLLGLTGEPTPVKKSTTKCRRRVCIDKDPFTGQCLKRGWKPC